MHPTFVPDCLLSRATTSKATLNVAKVQYKLLVASGLNLPIYGSMEWNVEENFSIEWNMEWKIFAWNGRKLPVWNMKKSFPFIPYHALLACAIG